MSEIKRIVILTAPVLNALFLCGMLLALAIVLTIAMILQYGFGEIPCPLCLLQRFAIFGCCFGLACSGVHASSIHHPMNIWHRCRLKTSRPCHEAKGLAA